MDASGYIAIEFKGLKVGIKFGMYANEQIVRKISDPDSGALLEDGSFSTVGVAYMLYYGYWNNCLAKEIPKAYTFEDFLEYTEDSILSPEGNEVLKRVGEVYSNARHTRKMVDNINEKVEDLKKKIQEQTVSTGITSKALPSESLASTEKSI